MMSFKTFVECKNKQLGYGFDFGVKIILPPCFFTQLQKRCFNLFEIKSCDDMPVIRKIGYCGGKMKIL